jgi:8-oxo-dGTP diphosphatase
MQKSIENLYGNKIRIRACGICIVNEQLLLVNHTGLTDGDFWAPPGGGIGADETAHEALVREFKEETNLTISVKDFLFVAEFYKAPLHAIELFFALDIVEGTLKTGIDPEMKSNEQIISDAQLFSWEQIRKMNPKHLHGIFNYATEPSKIIDLRGYFKL